MALVVCAVLVPYRACAQQPGSASGLTAVAGIEVGHFTLAERPTGCTVILMADGAVGGVDVRGGAPGTRETDLLDPINTVETIHAVVLSGGSAFGLDAASGVVRFLDERGVGFPVGPVTVPIVVGAILFDLRVGDKPRIRPGADCGYRAASRATSGPIEEGNVGAGAGATVGKLAGMERAMKAGIGTASFTLPNGLIVAALVAVNSMGDVVDPSTGGIVAGIRTADGNALADARRVLRARGSAAGSPRENTTIGVVATNARLTKVQATKMAQMAHDGLARAIVPAHTPWDGDTMFALATGTHEGEVDVTLIGALAAEATAKAIVRAAQRAHGLPGLPAARDLANPPQ